MSGIKLLEHLFLVLDTPWVNVDADLFFGAFDIILSRFSRDDWLLLLTRHGYHDNSEAPAHDCVAAEEVIVSLNEGTRALSPSIQPIRRGALPSHHLLCTLKHYLATRSIRELLRHRRCSSRTPFDLLGNLLGRPLHTHVENFEVHCLRHTFNQTHALGLIKHGGARIIHANCHVSPR